MDLTIRPSGGIVGLVDQVACGSTRQRQARVTTSTSQDGVADVRGGSRAREALETPVDDAPTHPKESFELGRICDKFVRAIPFSHVARRAWQPGGHVPRGVSLVDARTQLLGAAERLLRRDATTALSCLAVTTEAGLGKGVLHGHFATFDDLLIALAHERIDQLDEVGRSLMDQVGERTVGSNVTAILVELFDVAAIAAFTTVTGREGPRARLRRASPGAELPVLDEAKALLGEYLLAERDRGRLSRDLDPPLLAGMLIGSAHLLFAGRDGPRPKHATIAKVTDTILSGAAA